MSPTPPKRTSKKKLADDRHLAPVDAKILNVSHGIEAASWYYDEPHYRLVVVEVKRGGAYVGTVQVRVPYRRRSR